MSDESRLKTVDEGASVPVTTTGDSSNTRSDPRAPGARTSTSADTTGDRPPDKPTATEGPSLSADDVVDAPATATAAETVVSDAAPMSEALAETNPETHAETAVTTKAGSDKKNKTPVPKRSRNSALFRAFRSGHPVEARVERVIKGGYELRVGSARGFCPHSQMDVDRVEDPEQHLGKTYSFKVTQVRRGGDDVVLSRRAELEDARLEEAKAVRATLLEGAVMQGRVSGLAAFGAFVDLGAGVQGLVHATELSHSRFHKVEDAVKVGDAVQVKILKLDDERGRISLSLRQAAEDPWKSLADRIAVGQSYPGTIRRLADFGVFVEFEPGVEALAPAREFPPSKSGWRDRLQVGKKLDWTVLSVDARQRRLSVMPPYVGEAPPDVPVEVGATLKGRVQRLESYGVFVWLHPGRVGLMPNPLTGVPRGGDMLQRFPIDEEVEVEVVEISDDGKIRLAHKDVASQRAATAAQPRPDRRRERPKNGAPAPSERPPQKKRERVQPAEPETPFGTSLADKLRAALGRPD